MTVPTRPSLYTCAARLIAGAPGGPLRRAESCDGSLGECRENECDNSLRTRGNRIPDVEGSFAALAGATRWHRTTREGVGSWHAVAVPDRLPPATARSPCPAPPMTGS